MNILGPKIRRRAQCEAVLRTLPMWFGIEDSLLIYAGDSVRLPTFAVADGKRIVGFISLMQHFAQSWEVHCIAVRAESRNLGVGRRLMAHAEGWLVAQGARLLQVKTIAATSQSAEYAQTREFYSHLGFHPLQVFPDLWSAHNPCLQLVKFLPVGGPVQS